MRSRSSFMRWVVLVAAGMLASCGGGGGDAVESGSPADGTAPAETFTYAGGTVLPGRLVVTRPFGDLTVYDLRTGAGQQVGNPADEVWWQAARSPDTLLRYARSQPSGEPVRITAIDTTTWQPKGTELLWPAEVRHPKLSADGRYVLALWRDDAVDDHNNPMTVVEVSTGRVIRRDRALMRSELSATISSPADWLPDNTYVYLDGRRLFRASPFTGERTLVATLPLDDNLSTGGTESIFVELSASPDGKRIAFTWNGHIWVVGVDGTDLHRITDLDANSTNAVLGPSFGSPSWSPDSQWVSGVLFRSGSTVAPVFPDAGDTVAPPYQVIGTTGCASPVFVLRADATPTTITWPRWPVEHGVRVRSPDGRSVLGLSVCNSAVYWMP